MPRTIKQRQPLGAPMLALATMLIIAALLPNPAAAARANPFVVPTALADTVRNNSDEVRSSIPSLAGSSLRGVILGSTPLANVDGSVLAPGDTLAGYRLLRVDSRSAVFEHEGDVVVLQLDTGENP